MIEFFFHKIASQYQKPSSEKGPRKFPLIETDAKRKYITLHITLITFKKVGRLLTDNWIEHGRFKKFERLRNISENWGISRRVGERFREFEECFGGFYKAERGLILGGAVR